MLLTGQVQVPVAYIHITTFDKLYACHCLLLKLGKDLLIS